MMILHILVGLIFFSFGCFFLLTFSAIGRMFCNTVNTPLEKVIGTFFYLLGMTLFVSLTWFAFQ